MFGFVIVVVVAPTVVAVAEGVLGLSTVDILTDRFDSLGAFTVICINSALQIRTKPNCELKPFLRSLACVIAFVIVILVTVSQATSSDVPFLPIVLNLKPPPSDQLKLTTLMRSSAATTVVGYYNNNNYNNAIIARYCC